MLCQYQDLFGKPNQGIHSIRIGNFAIIDIIVTIGLAWFLAEKFNWNLKIVLVVVFVIGIFAHRIFCVRTQLDKIIFN